LIAGSAAVVNLNNFHHTYQVQLNGSFVQAGEGGAVVVDNWCHDSGQLGLRIVATTTTATTATANSSSSSSSSSNGIVARNVLWNVGAMVATGDYLTLVNNTLFDLTTVDNLLPGESFEDVLPYVPASLTLAHPLPLTPTLTPQP